MFRIILALAAAGIASEIPGILNVKIHKWLQASGALAVFAVVYFYSPASLVAQPDNPELKKKAELIQTDTADIKINTAAMKQYLGELVKIQTAAQNQDRRANDLVREQIYLTELEQKHNLPAGTLTNQLPAFAKKLAVDGTATSYDRAQGAFAAHDYVEAERLALLAADEAKRAIPFDKKRIIDALELAGWSANRRRDDVKAMTHLTAASSFTDRTEDPLQWARINHALAYALAGHGEHVQAEYLLRQVVLIRADKLGREHPDTLISRNSLAGALFAQAKYAEAEAEYRAVLKMFERILRPEHPLALGSRANLATALGQQGNLAEAEAEHRTVLKVEEAVLGPEHPDTLGSRNNVAQALARQGKYAEAEAEHRAVLKIRERVLGPEHPDTLISRNNLASALDDQGKNAEAEIEHRAVLKVMERVLGAEHPETLMSRDNLANALGAQGKLAEEESEHRAVLKVMERVVGPEHPDTLNSLYNLTVCLKAQGKTDEARGLAQLAVERARKALGSSNSTTKKYEGFLQKVSGGK